MSALRSFWDFFQRQLLGMSWLDQGVGRLLRQLGLPEGNPWTASLQFFIYDVIKITLLLCALIFTISYLQSYFPPERSRKILGAFGGVKAHLLAALLGTLTPFCSCSSIPIFMGFLGAGLPLGVSFSFLISSPMVDLASLILVMGIFGSRVAVLYVLLGLLIAVLGGLFISHMRVEEDVIPITRRTNILREDQNATLTRNERLRFSWEQLVFTFKRVFPYIVLGVAVGAVIHNWLPRSLIERLLGADNPFAVVMATLIGIPVYADIFGSIPVAESLLSQGAQLGAVLALMMAVTTLSIPSLTMLSKVIKPRLLTLFIAICAIGIILVGYFFNIIQMWIGPPLNPFN